MPLGEHNLVINQLFSALFQLPFEGMTDFPKVPQHLADDMKNKFSSSAELIKS